MIPRSLTGRSRVRRSWRGQLILQVEVREPGRTVHGVMRIFETLSWRDARVPDLLQFELPPVKS